MYVPGMMRSLGGWFVAFVALVPAACAPYDPPSPAASGSGTATPTSTPTTTNTTNTTVNATTTAAAPSTSPAPDALPAGYPPQPAGVAWPTDDWTFGELPRGVDRDIIEEAADAVFAAGVDTPSVRALVVVHGGRIVHERYDRRDDIHTVYSSWSVAKSVTAALAGMVVGDGLLTLDDPVPIDAWRGDGRSTITLEHLLRMTSGLEWTQSFGPGTDGGAMLDTEWAANVAINKPLVHQPGTQYHYSSGTSAVVVEVLAAAVGGPEQFGRYLRERLMEPLGITSTVPLTDGRGQFVGGVGFDSTARDFARFGLLHVRGGWWDGQQLLDAAWIDAARSPGPANDRYGLHWHLRADGGFAAIGLFGQQVVVLPHLDLVVVTASEPGGDPFTLVDVIAAQFAHRSG
jgi:CubicO group peptidase (beta-lactamase class C family)